MPNQKNACLLFVGLICGLFVWVDLASAQQSDDISQVRAATHNFFEASARKDLDALLNLWSPKAPELAAFTVGVRKTFSDVGNIELRSVEIHRVTAEAANSIVRVTVEMNATELKSGKPATGFGRRNHTLRFVKEDGRWKLWQYGASEEEFALALFVCKN